MVEFGLNIDFCPSLSAVDIDGITVGVANTGSLCGSLSTAIVEVLIFSHKKSQTYFPKICNETNMNENK